MSRLKKGLLYIVALLAMIQFIRPAYNLNNNIKGKEDISKVYNMPKNIEGLLKTSCYDCHSNSTNYPWYTALQPIGWWMSDHIKKGKHELNFNEFGHYSGYKQLSKLKAIKNSIQDETMPLGSYLLIHGNAKLSPLDRQAIVNWIEQMENNLPKK